MNALEPPTDAQLNYITDLCRKELVAPPDVVASKREASEIIEAIRAGTYRAADYSYPWAAA